MDGGLLGVLPIWAAGAMGATHVVAIEAMPFVPSRGDSCVHARIPMVPPSAAARAASPGLSDFTRPAPWRAARRGGVERRQRATLDRKRRARRGASDKIGAMPNYGIYRMKDSPRQQFRWGPHVSGCANVKPKDYEESGSIEAENEYHAWRLLHDSERPLQ